MLRFFNLYFITSFGDAYSTVPTNGSFSSLFPVVVDSPKSANFQQYPDSVGKMRILAGFISR